MEEGSRRMESRHLGGDFYSEPTYSLANRAMRAVWILAWSVLYWPSPRPMHAWRRFLLRLFGARIGAGCRIYPNVRVWWPAHLECGELVTIADGVTVYNQHRIRIGTRAVVSQGAHLCTATHDYTSPAFSMVLRPIEIGARAWIAAEAFVHPGVTIGEGAVIGARAVVTSDMPPWMVCAGHPCEPLKPREVRARA